MERLEPARSRVVFQSASGPLTVIRTRPGYAMNFPIRPAQQVPAPANLALALGTEPVEILADEFNYTAVLRSAQEVRELAPDLREIARLDRSGVVVTAACDAPHEPYDFVSRYFAPAKGIPEDPVTGGAHCMLVPYWSERLGKNSLRAYQASLRGGELSCRLLGDRVEMEGSCVFYLEGQVTL
jgi:predicted PhzF superfamily epimerase YddE/YHI9